METAASLGPGGTPGSETPRRYPLLYEINARVWLRALSEGLGRRVTLDDVPDGELDRIADLGFDVVWLMGVWPTGRDALAIARLDPSLLPSYFGALPDYRPADCGGSAFSVSAYRPRDEIGGERGLARFRRRLADRGIRLVLDFVTNHVGRDHPWVDSEPELFVRGTAADVMGSPGGFFANERGEILAHGRDPYFPPWTDTAQLDYSLPATRRRMGDLLLDLSGICDGVRCDMAMLVLPEVLARTWGARLGAPADRTSFWRGAIEAVKAARPDFVFLAEAYWGLESRLQEEGFDFTYDKGLYDGLRAGDLTAVRRSLAADVSIQARCARFIENHDEERAATAFGREGSGSAAAVTFFTPGMRLFHQGQIEGRRARIPVQIVRGPDEPPDLETVRFHEALLGLLREPIFQEDHRSPEVRRAGAEDATCEAILAHLWTWRDTDARRKPLAALVCANRRPARAYARIPLPASIFRAGSLYVLEDRLTGERYERPGEELTAPGLYVALGPHQAHLFAIEPA